MRTLQEVYDEIELTAFFADKKITDPNMEGHFTNHPLHIVSVWGDCEAIKILVDAGAEINIKGERGFTPIMEAISQRKFDAVKLLIQLGAKAIKNDEGMIPSELADMIGEKKIADLLRKKNL